MSFAEEHLKRIAQANRETYGPSNPASIGDIFERWYDKNTRWATQAYTGPFLILEIEDYANDVQVFTLLNLHSNEIEKHTNPFGPGLDGRWKYIG